MKVSVIVPTFNHRHFIGRCLDSIVSQSLDAPFEVIVLDDASTDGTQAVVKKYADKYPETIRPVLRETNSGDSGVSNVLNAYAETTSPYLSLLDGDDEALPGQLHKMVEFLDCHPECSLVGHCMQVVEDDKPTKVLYRGTPRVADIGYYCSCGLVLQGRMFRRSAIPEERFIFDPKNCANYDYIQQAQLAVRSKIGFIDEVLGIYRVQSASHTQTRRGDLVNKVLNGRIRALDYLRENQAISDDIYNVSLKQEFWNMCVEHLQRSNFLDFSAVIERALSSKRVEVQAEMDYNNGEINVKCKFRP